MNGIIPVQDSRKLEAVVRTFKLVCDSRKGSGPLIKSLIYLLNRGVPAVSGYSR